jgi:hypothetical protein
VVTRQRVSKAQRDRRRPLRTAARRQDPPSPKTHPSEDVYGVPVPERLHEAIELERENLSKVEALLACMAASMECQSHPLSGPYYPDVMQIARELVERSINSLDPFILKRHLLNKVGEGFRISIANQTYVRLHRLDSRQVLVGSSAWTGPTHRRGYDNIVSPLGRYQTHYCRLEAPTPKSLWGGHQSY